MFRTLYSIFLIYYFPIIHILYPIYSTFLVYPTLYIPSLIFLIPHFILHTLHSPLHTLTPHSIIHTLHLTLNTPHFTPDFALYNIHPHIPHSLFRTQHFTFHFIGPILHSICRTLHFTLCILHYTLHTPHSTLCTLHSTLHSKLYTPYSTPSFTSTLTLHTLHYHSTLCTPLITLFTSHYTNLARLLYHYNNLFRINRELNHNQYPKII